MFLGEALANRSDLQKRLGQVQSAAVNAARFVEGETPEESAAEFLAEARSLVTQLEDLVRRINRTNSFVELEDGFTIADAIARRDALAKRRTVVSAVLNASQSGNRYRTKDDLKEVTNVDVRALRREMDDLAREYRELDVRLQAANWTATLAD